MSRKRFALPNCVVVRRQRQAILIASLLVAGSLGGAAPAQALDVYLNYGSGYVDVVDNFFPDADPTPGVIQLSKLSLPGYTVNGIVDAKVGSTLTSILGSASAGLRLTSFDATAVGVPLYPLHVGFKDTLTGTFTGMTGADVIDAYVSNIVNTTPVPAGTDELMFWQGYLDLQTMGPAFGGPVPGFNPLFPGSSPPVAYPLYGHGSAPLVGTFVNPLLGADLYINLGASGDQFILLSSAEVGIANAVPEPTTLALLSSGLLGLGFYAWRRQRA